MIISCKFTSSKNLTVIRKMVNTKKNLIASKFKKKSSKKFILIKMCKNVPSQTNLIEFVEVSLMTNSDLLS